MPCNNICTRVKAEGQVITRWATNDVRHVKYFWTGKD